MLTPAFRELRPLPRLRGNEILLVGAWDIPTVRLAMHLRSARLNGSAPEPLSAATLWVDSAGVVCGMMVGVN